ncbi:hypothetical protein NCCP2716_23190 [Sporosarcina sp. NCCP-2716]|uniref:hypothetical protein n=1 Tax=Sporosarcina sp. NCCP-2716 TaxID=2943679 RepID=UPI00203F1184|nr:hypothetical protein [Sporosarcina sp. NCCP-2716]GKV69821.1 hypothetical protein NCCP2716_23190 [Sporosarcina sp. NCCP-2716]
MTTFIGVFGSHDTLSDRYQPISAATEAAAAEFMDQAHGKKYYRIYTVAEFIQERKAEKFGDIRPLPWIGEGYS